MFNKKMFVVTIMIALYMQSAFAAQKRTLERATGSHRSHLSLMTEQEVQEELNAVNASCPARFTETGCPLIVPALGWISKIPVVENAHLEQSCNTFNNDASGSLLCLGGFSALWLGTYFCLGWNVDKKRESLKKKLALLRQE